MLRNLKKFVLSWIRLGFLTLHCHLFTQLILNEAHSAKTELYSARSWLNSTPSLIDDQSYILICLRCFLSMMWISSPSIRIVVHLVCKCVNICWCVHTVQEQECLSPGCGFLPPPSGLCGHNRPEAHLQQTDRGQSLQDWGQSVHCKKRLAIFPSPDGMSLTKLFPWPGII